MNFGHDDINFSGQQASNKGDTTYNFEDQSGFTIVTKLKWSSAKYYETFFALKHENTSFVVSLNRFQSGSDLYVGFVDPNGVGCGSPAAGGTHGIFTPSSSWFLLKIVYDHSRLRLCQYVDSVEKCHACPSNFALPATVMMENWLGGKTVTNAFSGAIAGIYTFDRLLSSAEQTLVSDGININAEDSVF